jgi:hypothetical protein
LRGPQARGGVLDDLGFYRLAIVGYSASPSGWFDWSAHRLLSLPNDRKP